MIDVIKDPKHKIVYNAMLIGREMTVSEIADKIKREKDISLSSKSVAIILRSLSALKLVKVDEIKGHDVRVWKRLACVDDAPAPKPKKKQEPKEEKIKIADYFGMGDEAGLAEAWLKLAKREGHVKRHPHSQPPGQANRPSDSDKTAAAIITHLSKYGPTTVAKIAKALGMQPNGIGVHLRKLRESNRVTADTYKVPALWDVRKVGGRNRSELPKAIRAIMADGKPRTAREIAEETGWHRNTVWNSMKIMEREGYFTSVEVSMMFGRTKVRCNLYSLAKEGDE